MFQDRSDYGASNEAMDAHSVDPAVSLRHHKPNELDH